MKIGVDLDGVVFDSEEELRVYSELYDFVELKNHEHRDDKVLKFQERFKWKEQDIENFLKKYHEKIVKTANYKVGAKEVLHMLKEDGHELIMITARGGLNEKMIEITNERLKKDNMDIFDKCYYKQEEKEKICKQENIDIMIDDYEKNCLKISNEGIKTIYFKAAPSPELEENEYLKVLYNWGGIYRYITELS